MFASEFFALFAQELPGVLEIAVRYWYELAKHFIGILSNML
jgi:hypothetical protein